MSESVKTSLNNNDIEKAIVEQSFTVLLNGRTTICQLTLKNGFTVLGYASCVDIRNFDKTQGENISLENAKQKIWELEGYLLRQRLYEEDVIEKVREIKNIQGRKGNYDTSEYMRGMYNGLELAVATIDNRDPVFK